MGLIEVLGIDWRVLIAQFFNFAILLFVLYKFAYRPMFKMLDERRKKIEDGIENSLRAEERLAKIEASEKNIIKKAKMEAAEIIKKAKNDSEEMRKMELAKTKEEIGKMMSQERENMRIEKTKVLREINKEVSGLVSLALERVLGEKFSEKKDEDFIKKVITKIK